MGFKPIRYDKGKLSKVSQAATTTVAKYDALAEDGNGLYQRATSSTAFVPYVAMEAQVSTSAKEKLLVLATEDVEFIADCNASPTTTDVGTFADLTDHDTLNESSSSVDAFYIRAIRGAVANKEVYGRFTQYEGTLS